MKVLLLAAIGLGIVALLVLAGAAVGTVMYRMLGGEASEDGFSPDSPEEFH